MAKLAYDNDEVPVGAVIAMDGNIVATAMNEVVTRHDPTAHAEVLVIRKAAAMLGNERLNGATLYVTLEPCPMCAAACSLARLARVVWVGFLTSAPSNGLNLIFREIAEGNIATEPRSMLRVTGEFARQPESQLALNEFTVQRHGAGMISVETYVDRQMVATYHGDGVIVSTPTGSTAYSLSAGGPVVAPTCQCLVISPLAPHNLTMRPVVIPDTGVITLNVDARRADAFVTLDNRTYPVSHGASFTVERAEQTIFLAVPHNISFYDTLRNKMMWGIDIRS